MNEFKLSPDVEFKSLYDNAKYDVLKAKESVSKLTEEQKHQLVKELFGAEAVAILYQIMHNKM
jgi:hypothetical protein